MKRKKAHRLHKKVFDSLNSFRASKTASGGMGLRNLLSRKRLQTIAKLLAQIALAFNYSVSPLIDDLAKICRSPCSTSALLSVVLSFPIYHLYTHDDADDTHSWRLSLADNYMDCNRISSPSSCHRASFFFA